MLGTSGFCEPSKTLESNYCMHLFLAMIALTKQITRCSICKTFVQLETFSLMFIWHILKGQAKKDKLNKLISHNRVREKLYTSVRSMPGMLFFPPTRDVPTKANRQHTGEIPSYTHTQTQLFGLDRLHAVQVESLAMRTSMKCWQPVTGR